MRVIEPRHLQVKKKRQSKKRLLRVSLGIVAAGCLFAGLNVAADKHLFSRGGTSAVAQVDEVQAQTPAKKFDSPKTFTGNQFRDLYRSVILTYPNSEEFSEPPEITGNMEADDRIRKLAEARGFKLTRIPVTALVKTDEPLVKDNGDDLLQPLAFQSWQALKAAAKQENVPLALYSAFRSPDWQRKLFMERLLARGVTVQDVANGIADAEVNANFAVTAIPGYSRHHTGYAVDFWCDDGTGNFAASKCFKWLKKDNYQHAKEYGWIPSYPEDADEQGPEPEPWEYVWVGKTVLYN